MARRLIPSFTKLSLSTRYLIFAGGLVFIMTFFSFLMGTLDYKTFKKNQQNELKTISSRLNNKLTSFLDTTYESELFMGQQISQNNAQSLTYIYDEFKTFSQIRNDVQTYYSWPLYDWVNNHNMLTVNTRTGIAKPYDFSQRSYLQKTSRSPWKFFLSEPLIGYPSGEWVIVGSTGITDSKGRYLGSVGVGINIHQLIQMLEEITSYSRISFVITDNTGKVVLSSGDNPIAENSSFFNPNELDTTHTEGLLPHAIESNAISYSNYRKMTKYPYYIITGFDTNLMQQGFLGLILPRLLEFIVFGLISLSIMLLFWRWVIAPITRLSQQATKITQGKLLFHLPRSRAAEIVNLSKCLLQVRRYLQHNKRIQNKLHASNETLNSKNQELYTKQIELEQTQQQLEYAMQIAKHSDAAKEHFIRQVHADLKAPTITILDQIEHLILWLKESSSSHHLNLPHLPFLERIQIAALELKNFTRTTLQFKPVDIKVIIGESIRIHNKMTLEKHLQLKLNYIDPLPPIYGDAFRLKQILVSLLHRSIGNTPLGGTITLTCEPNNQAGTDYLKLTLEDTGFGLTEADHRRLKEKFGNAPGNDGTELELEVIQKLIELHHGHIHIHDEWKHGTKLTILLPCVENSENSVPENIYLFPSRNTQI